MPRSDESTIHRPSEARLAELAAGANLALNEQELEDYHALVNGALDDIERVAEANEPQFGVHELQYTDRSPGYRPDSDEDPYNAWITKCTVEGATSGPLSGMEIGLKDNIALAGYEMTCGSSVLEGYVPQIDATVVTRLLDAGATITGKLNMESFAWSGSSDTSDFGTVETPHAEGYLTGGSSSGSGAAPAAGDCDAALGGDQGGSIRVPSAWSGLVGLKPTTGLVPYTGIFPIDRGFDHTGPQARTVEDAAAILEVIAGEDVQDGLKMDPRQPRGVAADDYTAVLDDDIDDMSIGVLEEGFGWESSDPEVDDAVRDAVGVLEDLGAETESVSVETHRLTVPVWTAAGIQGGVSTLMDEGVGTNFKGWYWDDLLEAFGKFRRARAHEFPPTVKTALLADAHLRDEYSIEFYAKAKNLALDAERQYNRHLAEHDALVLPTTPMLPYEKNEDLSRVERVGRTLGNLANTGMFDLTNHPALTVPCAKPNDLPVGMMLVGTHLDETTLFNIASSFEAEVDWEER
jgi:amidase